MSKPARVVFLPPLQAEKQAYALARYSRSPDPIEDSLAWVETHSEVKFWESFYYDYGHASIADLGHVAACFEGVSELAAQEILDETLWDGQARSTRYQDFATTGHVLPSELAGHALEDDFHDAIERLMRAYREVHEAATARLKAQHPRPESMKAATYERNVAARAFDVARYLLPLAVPTSIGQVTSIRTLERQISRLLVSPLAEVRALADQLVEGCKAASLGGGAPPAPTLARHARPCAFTRDWRRRAAEIAQRRFPADVPPVQSSVTLAGPVDSSVELLSSLLYAHVRLPWSDLARCVESLPADERRALARDVLQARTQHDELPRAARVGYRYLFEIVMDVGGWRDMHRHRRCVQFVQEFDLEAGPSIPRDAVACGVNHRMLSEYEHALETARRIRGALGPRLAGYVLPLMHRVRSLFKMDLAEADYIMRLRSGVKGHPSYRRIAWGMHQELLRRDPEVAFLTSATPPDVEDPLTR